MIQLAIEGRTLGTKRRAKLFEDFSVPVPPPDPEPPGEDWDGGITLRQLITRVVRHEVAAFAERQNARQFVRALSKEEIQEGAAAGKVDSGGSEIEPVTVDPEAAVAVAIEGPSRTACTWSSSTTRSSGTSMRRFSSTKRPG